MSDGRLRRPIGERPEWHNDAACARYPSDWWWPSHERDPHIPDATRICGVCPVQHQCLTDALDDPVDQWSIRGGLTATQITYLRKRREAS